MSPQFLSAKKNVLLPCLAFMSLYIVKWIFLSMEKVRSDVASLCSVFSARRSEGQSDRTDTSKI